MAAAGGPPPHTDQPVYDRIGVGYAHRRRPEPTWEAQILAALGDARSVLNVGAGTGNYEPAGAIGLEPSAQMLAQRTSTNASVQGMAEALPFPDNAFDAAMGVLTVHHWNDRAAGLAELRRVASTQVLMIFESLMTNAFWLLEYFPEIAENDVEQNAPTALDIAEHLHVVDVQTMWIPANCLDGTAAAYWRRPEAYLLPDVQQSMSVLSLLDESVRARGSERLRSALADGSWHQRHGHILDDEAADHGYRLIIARNPTSSTN